jgi:hypothetical protein
MVNPVEILRAMADRIERNHEDEFAGCIVVIPPPSDNGDDPHLEILLIDPAQDVANFWSNAQGKVNGTAEDWKNRNSTQRSF